MDQILAAAGTLLAAVITALVPMILRLVSAQRDLAQQRALEVVQARLGAGAARIAGEIAATVSASPEVRQASRAIIDAYTPILADRFRDTLAKHHIPMNTLHGMIAGELGRQGVAIKQ